MRTAWLTALVAGLAGCATAGNERVVTANDRVEVSFTCRLPNGTIASSTEKKVADDPSLPKAPVFLASSGDEPIALPYGEELEAVRAKPVRAMEEEILSRLVDVVPGMRAGEKRTVKIAANTTSLAAGEATSIEMARVRVRPRQLRLTVEEYRARKGAKPSLGERYTIDPAFPGRVAEISGNQVVIEFAAPPDNTVHTPFGLGTVRELEDRYQVELDVRPGTTVRVGPLVGRITAVDDRHFTVDYSHSFGGEELECDVRVASVKPREMAAEKQRSVPPPDAATRGGLPAAEAEALLAEVSAAVHNAVKQGEETVTIEAAQAFGAEPGDLVTVHYTASLEDGTVFAATRESTATDQAIKKVSWYSPPAHYGAEEVVAGNREILPGLGDAVLGMKPGERKRLTLGPETAFGPADPKHVVRFPLARSMPRVTRMPAGDYVARFSSFPVVGKEVDLVPYFKSRVTGITDRDVALEFLAENGSVFEEPYGKVTVTVAADQVTTTLKPFPGAVFPVNEGTGVIGAVDADSFTVDFNHPLAGKTIVLEVEAVSLTKALSLVKEAPAWLESHDQGLAEAKKLERPAVLVLYADWCSFCKRLFAETMEDPRVKNLRDSLVWVKVNSDRETAIKQRYAQEGYPLIVLLRPDGSVAERIDGFRDGAAFSRLLKDFLAARGKVSQGR